MIFRESDLHMWAGRVSSLSGQNPTQRARKQKKQLFLLTYYLVIFAPWLKKRPHVSRSNCLLSWTHDPEIKNSSCKTQKSGERHWTIIFIGKFSLKQSLAIAWCCSDHLIGIEEWTYFTVYQAAAFLANMPGPWKQWFLEFGYLVIWVIFTSSVLVYNEIKLIDVLSCDDQQPARMATISGWTGHDFYFLTSDC